MGEFLKGFGIESSDLKGIELPQVLEYGGGIGVGDAGYDTRQYQLGNINSREYHERLQAKPLAEINLEQQYAAQHFSREGGLAEYGKQILNGIKYGFSNPSGDYNKASKERAEAQKRFNETQSDEDRKAYEQAQAKFYEADKQLTLKQHMDSLDSYDDTLGQKIVKGVLFSTGIGLQNAALAAATGGAGNVALGVAKGANLFRTINTATKTAKLLKGSGAAAKGFVGAQPSSLGIKEDTQANAYRDSEFNSELSDEERIQSAEQAGWIAYGAASVGSTFTYNKIAGGFVPKYIRKLEVADLEKSAALRITKNISTNLSVELGMEVTEETAAELQEFIANRTEENFKKLTSKQKELLTDPVFMATVAIVSGGASVAETVGQGKSVSQYNDQAYFNDIIAEESKLLGVEPVKYKNAEDMYANYRKNPAIPNALQRIAKDKDEAKIRQHSAHDINQVSIIDSDGEKVPYWKVGESSELFETEAEAKAHVITTANKHFESSLKSFKAANFGDSEKESLSTFERGNKGYQYADAISKSAEILSVRGVDSMTRDFIQDWDGERESLDAYLTSVLLVSPAFDRASIKPSVEAALDFLYGDKDISEIEGSPEGIDAISYLVDAIVSGSQIKDIFSSEQEVNQFKPLDYNLSPTEKKFLETVENHISNRHGGDISKVKNIWERSYFEVTKDEQARAEWQALSEGQKQNISIALENLVETTMKGKEKAKLLQEAEKSLNKVDSKEAKDIQRIEEVIKEKWKKDDGIEALKKVIKDESSLIRRENMVYNKASEKRADKPTDEKSKAKQESEQKLRDTVTYSHLRFEGSNISILKRNADILKRKAEAIKGDNITPKEAKLIVRSGLAEQALEAEIDAQVENFKQGKIDPQKIIEEQQAQPKISEAQQQKKRLSDVKGKTDIKSKVLQAIFEENPSISNKEAEALSKYYIENSKLELESETVIAEVKQSIRDSEMNKFNDALNKLIKDGCIL